MSHAPLILPWRGVSPRIDPSVYLAPTCTILGDVEIGRESSVWFGTVIRGDVHRIRIGQRTNIQDLSMIHVQNGKHDTIIGDEVTAGHRVTLHGCHVGDRCLLGMGCILMDGVRVGNDVIVAAGALLPPGMEVPDGVLVIGAPAKVKRELTEEEKNFLKKSAQNYVEYSREYFAAFPPKP